MPARGLRIHHRHKARPPMHHPLTHATQSPWELPKGCDGAQSVLTLYAKSNQLDWCFPHHPHRRSPAPCGSKACPREVREHTIATKPAHRCTTHSPTRHNPRGSCRKAAMARKACPRSTPRVTSSTGASRTIHIVGALPPVGARPARERSANTPSPPSPPTDAPPTHPRDTIPVGAAERLRWRAKRAHGLRQE